MSLSSVTVFAQPLDGGAGWVATTYKSHGFDIDARRAATKAAARFFDVGEERIELLQEKTHISPALFIATVKAPASKARPNLGLTALGIVAFTAGAMALIVEFFSRGGAR